MKSTIAKPLLRWYSFRRRNLPWRERPQPYAVWVAETMAQQTRLESMLPYYSRWMRRFPTLKALAAAREQDVLSLWEGLGYYNRARNLRKAAQVVMREHAGRLPKEVAELRKLPGVGPYTAGMIASLAFEADEPAVDGNAVRVLSRLFDVPEPADTTAGRRRLWALAAENLPPGRAADYNQALMDLGAIVCIPRPKCAECPLRLMCLARRRGTQHLRPVKAAAAAVPLRDFAGAVIRRGGRVLVVQRPGSGLLAGMWEFPNIQLAQAKRPETELRRVLRSEFALQASELEHLGVYEHAYSHFQARLQVYGCELNGGAFASQRAHKWLPPRRLKDLPMGKLDRRVADSLLEQ